MPPRSALRSSWLSIFLTACGGDAASGVPTIDVGYDAATREILVRLDRAVASGETLHTRVRWGEPGELDCAAMATAIPRIDGRRHADEPSTYVGPQVEPDIFEPRYGIEWLEAEPTPEMLAALAEGEPYIDVCVMRDGEVVAYAELDIHRALDVAGSNGKYDGTEEERIASVEAYADLCVAKLGEIPFFPAIGESDFATYDCLDATAIPTTVTGDDGVVTHPSKSVEQCDNPEYIYSICEPNAVDGETNGPRVASARNDEGTQWVLLCRKADEELGEYNDMAMIGHNPFSGETCYFQNALFAKTDGLHIAHPGDRVESEASPQMSTSTWGGLHGGIGSGIQCARCHSTDPFIHTPWIDQAVDENGDPIVPKMGVNDDFVLGFNDMPYTIVNAEGQGWTTPRQLVSEEAAACTRCHRIADDRWSDDWFDRLEGIDTSWSHLVTPAYSDFVHTFWMPPDADGLDAETWADSEYARAMAFIRECTASPDGDGCEWAELPRASEGGDGELPEVDLVGKELAVEALAVLGADFDDPSCMGGSCASRRCSECHSVSRLGLRGWHDLTRHAWDDCGLDRDPASMSADEAKAAIECLRLHPDDPKSPFAAEKLGILTTGVNYGFFRALFRVAHGDEWLEPYTAFSRRVSMPKGNHPRLSGREHAVLLKWFGDGLPALEETLPEVPPPSTCTEDWDDTSLATHIDAMQFDGWQAVNADNGVHLHGCPDDDPRQCFASTPERPEWGPGVRELHRLDFATSFWMRTSADGRFVGNGGGRLGATITDLASGHNIAVKADYDPGFFPDNSGFIFQSAFGGAGICSQSLLHDDDEIDFSEKQCIKATGINLYQHVARGLGGGDYLVINSQFQSDPGFGDSDPSATFPASSTLKLTPMLFDGTRYLPQQPVVVGAPYEGDSVLSPSGSLVVSRLAGADGTGLGYVIRRVKTTTDGAKFHVDVDERLATVCMPGAKVNVSFDERWLVTHHHENGVINIYLVDLLTHERRRITDMPAGHRALFPHFVSSGWIYFMVQGPHGERWVAASDAAVAP